MNTNKKKYEQPLTITVQIQLTQMIAGSGPGSSYQHDPTMGARYRGRFDDDWEEDWEDWEVL